MQHVKRSGFCMKTQRLNILRSSHKGLKHELSDAVSGLRSADFSSPAAEISVISDISKRVSRNSIILGDQWAKQRALFHQSPFPLATITGQKLRSSCFIRCFGSKTTESNRQKGSQTRKEISTVEDPFDAPTYNIPEKPVTFTEGASYSLIILAGLGIAGAAAYGVFKELIFEPKEYKIFNKALDRVQNDGQVRVRLGSPITGYGSESRNRAARQRIPNRTWTDEDGVEHILVNFHVRGPHGAGRVHSEMFKDKVDKQWKFMYLIVEVTSPSPAQLMLESYIPA
ncbi:mitochondrial import inner membrane translocase subunit tim21 [Orobanche minor]